MEKFISRRTRQIGPYTPGKRSDEVKAEFGLDHVVKMSSNESVFGVSQKVADALCEMAPDINLYPASGDKELCERMAELLEVSPEQIIMGNGSDAVIYNLGMTIIEPGDEIIIPEITFSIYKTITEIMGGRVVSTPLKQLRIDLEAILEHISRKTKAVFLCNPNNPTGDTLDPDEIKDFLRQVPEHVLVVLDEAYIDFVDDEMNPGAIELLQSGMRNLFILRTLSKSYGIAGLRLGYGVGDKELINYMNRVKQPFEVSLPAQRAGMAALSDQDFLHGVIESTKREMQFFRESLQRLGLDYVDSQTNFFLIDTGVNADTMFLELQKQGIIIRPGSIFGLPTHIRVTVGSREQNREFFEVLANVLAISSSEGVRKV